MQRARNLVTDSDNPQFTRALHRHPARASLIWLLRVHRGNGLRGFRDGAVMLLDQLQRLRRLEVSDNRGRRVIRPVKGPIKFLELLDWHMLDVAAPSDRGVMIGM